MFDFKNVGGFVFDCDGTLLDTIGAWDEAEEELFSQIGPMTQEQENEIHAAPIERAAEILHERYGVGASSADVLAHFDNFLIPYYGEKANPMVGAIEFVRAARSHGIPCVVVSSSPRRYLEAGLRRAGILDCFSALISTDEVGASKQDFAIYEVAEHELGCNRDRIWAVDDAPYAIAVMHEFGMNTICVGHRHSEFAELDIETLAELLA